jgi:23S rRNA (cytosine1962-C5)-methyltransferase
VPPPAVVSDRAKKRLKTKHPWIFSNELLTKPDASAGDLVTIQDPQAHFLGIGYYNPHTLIAIRILSFTDQFNFAERIHRAIARRKGLGRVCRLVYSESDGLPGLIVDRYEDTLVAQILTAGMEKFRDHILSALRQEASKILLRNDSSYRELEGLPLQNEWVHGEPVDREIIEVDGIRFWIDYQHGQKTGFFLDQRENRKRLLHYGAADRMLDVFSYSGAWSMYGAKAGVREIIAVDSSADALKMAEENARLNAYEIRTIQAQAIDFLHQQYHSPDRFDRIVLDPPAFCKSKRNLPAALRAYREINLRAMKLIRNGGLLFSCSCSQPVTPNIFLDVLHQAAAASGRAFFLRDLLFQPADHPILMNFPESHYLKCAILELV